MILLVLLAITPAARAREVATKLKFAHDAMLEWRREAGAIEDPALRAAVEAQILTPWLPAETWAYAHPQPGVELPPPRKGDFAAAPGEVCEDGHHGYPGGLAVRSLANLLHARALAQVYRHVYSVEPQHDWLVAAAIWHDSLKAGTPPRRADGSCGPGGTVAR